MREQSNFGEACQCSSIDTQWAISIIYCVRKKTPKARTHECPQVLDFFCVRLTCPGDFLDTLGASTLRVLLLLLLVVLLLLLLLLLLLFSSPADEPRGEERTGPLMTKLPREKLAQVLCAARIESTKTTKSFFFLHHQLTRSWLHPRAFTGRDVRRRLTTLHEILSFTLKAFRDFSSSKMPPFHQFKIWLFFLPTSIRNLQQLQLKAKAWEKKGNKRSSASFRCHSFLLFLLAQLRRDPSRMTKRSKAAGATVQ